MEKEQKIQKLLDLAKVETNVKIKTKLIGNLCAYGPTVLPGLFELMEVETNNEVKESILDAIADIEKQRPPQSKRSMRT